MTSLSNFLGIIMCLGACAAVLLFPAFVLASFAGILCLIWNGLIAGPLGLAMVPYLTFLGGLLILAFFRATFFRTRK